MARQWHIECSCVPELAEERITQEWIRMHSEVTANSLSYFFREGRVPPSFDRDEMERLVEDADTVAICNVCNSVKADHGDGFDDARAGGPAESDREMIAW